MRAKLGRDARLAEVTDRGEYAAAAVASACASRGHWLRYAMRGVLDPETSSPFLVLSGPGMDSDAAPGLTRPDDDQGALDLSEALRARCVEEAARVGDAFLLDAFNDTDGQSSKAPADAEADADDDDSDSGVIIHIDRKEEHAAAFAYVLCGRGAREEGGGAETAVRGDRRPPPSRRGDLRGGARSGDDAKPFKSRLSKDRRRRRRRRRRRDERRRRPSVRFAEEVRGPPSGIRGGHARRRARRGVRLGPRRRPRRRRRRLRAAVPLGVERRHRAGRRVREGSLRRAHGRLYRRRLHRRRLYRRSPGGSAQGTTADARSRGHRGACEGVRPAAHAAAEAAAPRGSPEAAAAATRAARALVAEHPGFDGGRLAGALERDVGEEEDPLPLRDGDENKDEENKDERKPRSRRCCTTPSRSARTSRACASPSPPRGAPPPRAGSTRRRGWRSRTCWPRRATPEAAFDEYAEALYYLPYHGEIAAAATTRAGAAAAAAAHRLAGFCRTMTEALEETGTLSRGDEAAEADGGDEERPRVTPERVEEIASRVCAAPPRWPRRARKKRR